MSTCEHSQITRQAGLSGRRRFWIWCRPPRRRFERSNFSFVGKLFTSTSALRFSVLLPTKQHTRNPLLLVYSSLLARGWRIPLVRFWKGRLRIERARAQRGTGGTKQGFLSPWGQICCQKEADWRTGRPRLFFAVAKQFCRWGQFGACSEREGACAVHISGAKRLTMSCIHHPDTHMNTSATKERTRESASDWIERKIINKIHATEWIMVFRENPQAGARKGRISPNFTKLYWTHRFRGCPFIAADATPPSRNKQDVSRKITGCWWILYEFYVFLFCFIHGRTGQPPGSTLIPSPSRWNSLHELGLNHRVALLPLVQSFAM